MRSTRDGAKGARLAALLLVAAPACASLAGIDEWGGGASQTHGGGGAPMAASASGVGGAGGLGGAGGPTIEDCTNGVDDDGDGHADCLDDDCPLRQCVANAPRGAFVVPAVADRCPAGTTPMLLTPCGGCSCDAAPGGCTAALALGATSACTGAMKGGTGCFAAQFVAGAGMFAQASLSTDGTATCAPVDDSDVFQVCRLAPPVECAPGSACLPDDACVIVEGASCPEGWTNTAGVLLHDATAGSPCGCSCGDPVATCASHVTLYDNIGCVGGRSVLVPVDGSCMQTSLTASQAADAPPPSVECTSSTQATAPLARCCR